MKVDEYNYVSLRRPEEYAEHAKLYAPFRENLRAGSKAPDFTVKSLDGQEFCLSDYKRKKNVVLEFGSVT